MTIVVVLLIGVLLSLLTIISILNDIRVLLKEEQMRIALEQANATDY